MISSRGTTIPMVKAIGRGVAEIKTLPLPSLGVGDGIGDDVMGKGVALLIVVETCVAMGVISGVGEQEYIAVE